MVVADYYSMLGVAPGSDRAAIESALARAQPTWSAGTRNPKNKHTFQSYLDRIPAIRQALLGDPASRAAYDAELAAARRAELDAKLDELQRLIKLRSAKGGLTVSDRTLLRGEADRLEIASDEFQRLLQPYPPMPETPAAAEADEPSPDILDPTTRRQVRIALDHIRRRNLYDVVGLPADAPIREIAARADDERRKWMHKTQVTAEKTAWLEAVSYAQSHLSNPEARARYDRTLSVEAEERLGAAIDFALQGSGGLAPGTRQALRDEALLVGVTTERADRLIDRACRSLGVSREGVGGTVRLDGLVRYLRCRTCTGLTEYALASRSPDSAICRHCRADLRWTCPVCRRSRWVDEPRCACGFPLEHVEPLVRYFEAAQHAHRTRDFASALANLKRVQEFAPRHIGARKGIEKIKERLVEIDGARSAYEIERSRRHLVAARGALMTWGRMVDPTTPELRQAFTEVAEGLRQATALVAKAESIAEDEPRAALKLYRQALSIAADLPEARDGLRHCPPPPPIGLFATLAADRVRLRWTAAASDGIGPCSYRIQRKRGALPAHADDGVTLAELDATEFEDESTTPGDTVGYAVYSIRGGVASLAGAPAGPVPILADVTDLKAEAGSREVLLTWNHPANSFDVRVVRKLGSAPTGQEDGTPVSALRGQALDRGLDDDTVYHYGVFVLYRTSGGRPIASRGAFLSCMPSVPILTVIEPAISRDGDGLRVSWSPPARGQVQVFRSTSPFPHPPGDVIDRKTLDGVAGLWVPRSSPDHVLDRPVPTGAEIHYTPMIAWAGRMTVGRTVSYSHLPDPTELRAIRVGRGGKVVLRWKWPTESTCCLLVARIGAVPAGASDPLSRSVRVELAAYQELDSFAWTLPQEEARPWHVVVLVCRVHEGRQMVSPGMEFGCRVQVSGQPSEVEVSYTLTPPSLLRRAWSIAFRTDPPGLPIPPLVVVAHPRTIPVSHDDGDVMARLPAGQDRDQHQFRARRSLAKGGIRVFADPRADSNSVCPIRLRHPDAEAPRV